MKQLTVKDVAKLPEKIDLRNVMKYRPGSLNHRVKAEKINTHNDLVQEIGNLPVVVPLPLAKPTVDIKLDVDKVLDIINSFVLFETELFDENTGESRGQVPVTLEGYIGNGATYGWINGLAKAIADNLMDLIIRGE